LYEKERDDCNMKKEENKKNIWFAIGRFIFGLLLASFLFIASKAFQLPMNFYLVFPIAIGLYFMLTGKFKIRLDITLLIIAIIFIGLSLNSSYTTKLYDKPLSDLECAQHMELRVSDAEFGPLKDEFLVNGGIYPAVNYNISYSKCKKRIGVYLLDINDKKITEKSSNLYPEGNEGQNDYGDYNINKTLTAGTYFIEGYYGDALIKKIQITVK
jgi:hypothetical protein